MQGNPTTDKKPRKKLVSLNVKTPPERSDPSSTNKFLGHHPKDDRYFKAFHCNPDPVTISTLGEGRYIEVNEAFLKVSGYQRHEVIGHTALELNIWVNPDQREMLVNKLRTQGYNSRDEEVQFRTKSGEIRIFLYSTEIIDIDGIQHLLFVTRDITERKRIEEALRSSEDRFAKAFNASPAAMAITSLEDGRIFNVNDSFCRCLSFDREEIIGQTSSDIGFWIKPDNRNPIVERINSDKSISNLEIEFGANNGRRRQGLYSAEVIEIDGKKYILSIVTDVTDSKQAEDEITFLSFHDKLTGLYNRAYFEEKLLRYDTRRMLPVSLIIGDVNGLKIINEALGHHQGDLLLKAVADCIRKCCRSEDIIARWGGDEFIILLPNCSSDRAESILENIKNSCLIINVLPIQISISLGTSTKIDAGLDIREIIKEAENKMYRNKLLNAASVRSAFLNSLQNALWTRSHETEAHCQRLQEIVMKVGQALNLCPSDMDNLRLLAALHDIGKIAIPNSILDKPGELNFEEWETMRRHPEIGHRIALSSPEMAPIAEAILHHHEHWDGSGYPQGKRAEEIPLLSRILAIADAYDVMLNGRPYQAPISHAEALGEIQRCAGGQFDPYLVEKAIKLLK